MRKTHGLAALMPLAPLATIPARAGVNEWTSIGPDGGYIQALAIDPQNPATVYASAGNKATFKSTDGGMSWAKTGLTSFAITLVVDPHNSDTVYAATLQGVVKSTDGGITWSAGNSGLTDVPIVRWLLIDPRNSGTVYLGTDQGVFRSTDGGEIGARSIRRWGTLLSAAWPSIPKTQTPCTPGRMPGYL